MVFDTLDDVLSEDEIFPDDLLELGFFITEDGKIRYIHSPDQSARYKINRNERVNQAHLESLHKAIRSSIYHRLVGIGMNLMQNPDAGPHAPIFISSNINTAFRVVVFFGEVTEDLGMFSYRDASDDGLSFGSVLGIANAVLGENPSSSPTALILANIGQNVWYNGGGVAMTAESFNARVRSCLVGRQRPLSRRNIIANNTSIKAHVEWIFEQILKYNLPLGAKVDILGLSEGGHFAMEYLRDHWSMWGPRISSMSLVNPQVMNYEDFHVGDLINPKSFAFFRRFRTRAWVLSDAPIGNRVAGLPYYGCNTYSCGEATKTSCMITRGLGDIRSWINVMYACPAAKESIDVLPGETGFNDGMIDALYSTIPFPDFLEVPRMPVEVESRAVLGQIVSSVVNVGSRVNQFIFSDNSDDGVVMHAQFGDTPTEEGLFVDEKSEGDDGEAFGAQHVVPSARGIHDISDQTRRFTRDELQILRDIE